MHEVRAPEPPSPGPAAKIAVPSRVARRPAHAVVLPRPALVRRAVAAALGVLVGAGLFAGCGGDGGWVARDVPGDYPSIQAAVDAARPGDLVRIAPGAYREGVVVAASKRDVVIRGEDRDRVVLDGERGRRAVGIMVRGAGTAVENLTVRGFRTAGVLVETPAGAPRPLRGWRVGYVNALGDGRAGLVARRARGGTVDHVLARGHTRAGVLLADCGPCDTTVLDSAADHNRVGLEARDASGNVVVARSRFRHNRVGILMNATRTDEGAEPQREVTVAGNVIADNDNDDARGAERAERSGIGVLVHGGRRDAVARNRIARHDGAGVLLEGSPAGPTAEVSVQGNVLSGDGVDLAVVRGPHQPSSKGSCFAQNRFASSYPTDIERRLPCQADVPLPPGGLLLAGSKSRRAAPRRLPPPAQQAQLAGARTTAPVPARSPARLDVARIGVPSAK
jgi:Periplasmic copper-binding protein (NosD)